MFFLIEKHKILIKLKKSTKVSLTASQQPLFVVPEHMTHPVHTYKYYSGSEPQLFKTLVL